MSKGTASKSPTWAGSIDGAHGSSRVCGSAEMNANRRMRMELSIVVPVYRSAPCLPELARRIEDTVGRHVSPYELILVNDDSPDESWKVITRLAGDHPAVVGVNLRRNVGQDNAFMAALRTSRARIVIIMVDDLKPNPHDNTGLMRGIPRPRAAPYSHVP